MTASASREQGSTGCETAKGKASSFCCWNTLGSLMTFLRPPQWTWHMKVLSWQLQLSLAFQPSHQSARQVSKEVLAVDLPSQLIQPHPLKALQLGTDTEKQREAILTYLVWIPDSQFVNIIEWLLFYASKFWSVLLITARVTRTTSTCRVTIELKWPTEYVKVLCKLCLRQWVNFYCQQLNNNS